MKTEIDLNVYDIDGTTLTSYTNHDTKPMLLIVPDQSHPDHMFTYIHGTPADFEDMVDAALTSFVARLYQEGADEDSVGEVLSILCLSAMHSGSASAEDGGPSIKMSYE